MPAAQAQRVRFLAGPAFETLIGVSALTRDDVTLDPCSPALRQAIEAVGVRSSELWLHLLGLALERPDDIVAAVRAAPARELRRHLAGVYVPAWREIVGVAALEATARGDERLLDHERYYAGRARASLELLLSLTPAETKRRVLAVLERYSAELLDAGAVADLEREVQAKSRLRASPAELVALAAPGYRYEPEPDLPEIVLVPHKSATPWLLLCQHERTRIICYPVASPQVAEERLVALGRALGDERRARMLTRLRRGEATLAELAQSAEVAKSTAHHHLGLLRTAGLVEMRGNARGYSFSLLPEGRSLLGYLDLRP